MGSSYDRGRKGEQIALQYLCKKGYSLLFKNFRVRSTSPLSEIDLIFLAPKNSASKNVQEILVQRSLGGDIFSSALSCVVDEYSFSLDIVFVEVKNWGAYPATDLAYNLNKKRQQRMFDTADCFLQRYPQFVCLSRRFDLVIIQKYDINRYDINHIESAFP